MEQDLNVITKTTKLLKEIIGINLNDLCQEISSYM